MDIHVLVEVLEFQLGWEGHVAVGAGFGHHLLLIALLSNRGRGSTAWWGIVSGRFDLPAGGHVVQDGHLGHVGGGLGGHGEFQLGLEALRRNGRFWRFCAGWAFGDVLPHPLPRFLVEHLAVELSWFLGLRGGFGSLAARFVAIIEPAIYGALTRSLTVGGLGRLGVRGRSKGSPILGWRSWGRGVVGTPRKQPGPAEPVVERLLLEGGLAGRLGRGRKADGGATWLADPDTRGRLRVDLVGCHTLGRLSLLRHRTSLALLLVLFTLKDDRIGVKDIIFSLQPECHLSWYML